MSSIIEVENLSKSFQIKQKENSLSLSVKAFFLPRYKEVKAVEEISFSVKAGERVAFIGPNGAGKSTTIKMLTGILYPTSGKASVLGLNPATQRKRLAFHIGTVFGQKPQLWYHLPALETLKFLSRIYEISASTFKARLAQLTEALVLADLLDVPVRKLSLGQRMRCEIAASLLHHPKILFLDEPTIGLDVVAKEQIRDVIRNFNKQEQTTIFLTSHDPSDIETLAQRTIVVNHGKILFDDSTVNFMHSFIRSKTVELILKKPIDKPHLPTGRLIVKDPYRLKVEIDITKDPIDKFLSYAVSNFEIQDINIYDPEMEQVIRAIYQNNARIG